MPYVRKTWECGDVVTDEALNNIEDGIEEALQGGGAAGLVVHVVIDDEGCEGHAVLDKTYAEIEAAIQAGTAVTFVNETIADGYTARFFFDITAMSHGEGGYYLSIINSSEGLSLDFVATGETEVLETPCNA